jgi:hypothetical protein
MTGEPSTDESDDSDGKGSDENNDVVSAASFDSLGEHVMSSNEVIPGDAFELFKCWVPKYESITNLVY